MDIGSVWRGPDVRTFPDSVFAFDYAGHVSLHANVCIPAKARHPIVDRQHKRDFSYPLKYRHSFLFLIKGIMPASLDFERDFTTRLTREIVNPGIVCIDVSGAGPQ